MNNVIFVTGGAGFIGSSVIRYLINNTDHHVVNIDKLTYASNLNSLNEVSDNDRYHFEQIDICDGSALEIAFNKYQPDIIMNLAAESHVDRSIDGASPFIQTNIVGTFTLLEVTKNYWKNFNADKKKSFRFHHISTDEVYGDLELGDPAFTETTSYSPNSPYSASKASSDHLVKAWHATYGLPTLISNCSNNYGPYHHPEKLIPHIILNALHGKKLPIYGDGTQIRDWLYVEDHARALVTVATTGEIGETYNIGGNSECTNINVVKNICDLLEELAPTYKKDIEKYSDLITHVNDRPGHDKRYAINATKIKNDLGFEPIETFESGLRKTVTWYLNNRKWWTNILDDNYELKRIGTTK